MAWCAADLVYSGALPALNCSMVPAHPYVFGLGQETSNGSYLSPANACQYLAGKLASTGGSADAVVMMVCSTSQSEFLSALNALAAVFPVPSFTQVARIAQASATLAVDKMQLPDKPRNVLPDPVPLSITTNRTVSSSAAISQSQAAATEPASVDALTQALTTFANTCQQIATQAADDAAAISATSARIWAFSITGELVTAASEIIKNVPDAAAGYTAAMLFVAPDLSALKAMIKDINQI